jgi:formylmethanofuran dehydrogenase subunit E
LAHGCDVSTLPPEALSALKSLSGYEQMLEIDRICRVYNTDEATVRAALAQHSAPAPQPSDSETPSSWDTSHKDVPTLQEASGPAAPQVIDKGQFRFEYDPTREAAARREQVNQAILCSACGVALGIPDVRPIKVTCPSCLFETTYTH